MNKTALAFGGLVLASITIAIGSGYLWLREGEENTRHYGWA